MLHVLGAQCMMMMMHIMTQRIDTKPTHYLGKHIPFKPRIAFGESECVKRGDDAVHHSNGNAFFDIPPSWRHYPHKVAT